MNKSSVILLIPFVIALMSCGSHSPSDPSIENEPPIGKDLTIPIIQLVTTIPDTINNHFVVKFDLTDNSNNLTVYVVYSGDTIKTIKNLTNGMTQTSIDLDTDSLLWTKGSLVFKVVDPSGNRGTTEIYPTLIRNSFTSNGLNAKMIIDLNYYKEIGSHDALGGAADAYVTLIVTSYANGNKLVENKTTQRFMGQDKSLWTGSAKDTISFLSYTDSIEIKSSVIDKDIASNDNISPSSTMKYTGFKINTTYSDTLTGGASNVGFSYIIVEE